MSESATVTVREFELPSAVGGVVRGQADVPAGWNGTAVIMVAGTGPFDRDVFYGFSGTPRDLLFKDLAARFAARGVAAVRYDKRGIRPGIRDESALDTAVTATTTTTAQREDLSAIHAWVRSPDGLGAGSIIFFGHSEGMLHIGRLAASGAPAPVRVIGVGAAMRAPKTILHWQMVERDPFSIRMLDEDGDGIVSNEDVRAGYKRTPAAPSAIETLLSETGFWDAAGLARLRAERQAAYDEVARTARDTDDMTPYPNTETAVAAFEWWKSWFIDDETVAERVARWGVPLSLHYGSLDSQTNEPLERAAAEAALSPDLLTITVHPGVGHGLGPDPSIGPMDETLADALADEAAAA